ncbi:MAG: hypothetical protein KKD17_01995 [Nanoarchaeota archaeon]|nr:hypothetical protein [Nanoarchaeota archaeon]
MVFRQLRSRRAEVLSLVIVLAVIAVMGVGAFLMSKGRGSEISFCGTT